MSENPINIDLDNLSQRVREAFLTKKLVKGFTQVINAIVLHKNLEIYVAGNLDPLFDEKFNQTRLLIDNPQTQVHYLSSKEKRLVYDSIANVPNINKKTPSKPKKYF